MTDTTKMQQWLEALPTKNVHAKRGHAEAAVAFVTYDGGVADLNELARYVEQLEAAIASLRAEIAAPAQPADYYRHEAFDRTHLAREMLSLWVAEHPFIKNRPDLTRLVHDAAEKLGEVYQTIGEEHLGEAPSPPVQPLPEGDREMKSEQTGGKGEGGSECVYLIQFDDYDRRPEIFTTKASALARFEQISTSWNAHLFVKVRSNTRDDPRYDSNAPLPAAADEGDFGTKLTPEVMAHLHDKHVGKMQPLPEGWVVVPRKLPEEVKRVLIDRFADSNKGASLLFTDIWRDLLAAAPTTGTAEGESHG